MDEPSSTDRTEQRLSALESAVEEIRDTLAHTAQRERPDEARRTDAGSSAPNGALPSTPGDEPTGLDEILVAESSYERLKTRLAGRTASLPGRPRDL